MHSISEIIKFGESEIVEYKQSFDKEVIETITSFANNKGGQVFIGIKDNGEVIGVNCTKETLQNYINQIKVSTEPSLIVDIDHVKISGKDILIIKVDEFPIKPVSFKGRYFTRVKNSNHQMSLTEIANAHLHSLQLSWDAYPSNDTVIADLNKEKIQRFISRVNEGGRFKLTGAMWENLQKLNLMKDQKPTNAAKLLFAKEGTVYNIHIGRFKTPSMILDDKMIRNTLFESVEETMMYILSHIKVAFEFTGEIQRNEIFEYPVSALTQVYLSGV